MQELVTAYLQEKAPTRKDTRRLYQVWLRCHILPKWGDHTYNAYNRGCPLGMRFLSALQSWQSLDRFPRLLLRDA